MGSYNNRYTSSSFTDHRFNESNGYDDDLVDEMSTHSVEEPPWLDKVNERGQVFYIEASDPVEYVTPHSHPTNSPTPIHFQNGHRGKKESKSNRKKRLKNLLGSNSSKRTELTDGALNRHNLNSNGHGVTFNDVATGVMREVTIFVDPFKNNYGRRTSKCEALFGIVPGHFGAPSHESDGPPKDRRIMVQGLVPGQEAIKAGVKIGEWLMCVNDLEVTYDNLDSILTGITGPRYIKLTLQKVAVQASPKQVLVKKAPVIGEGMVRLVSGERLAQGGAALSLPDLPHSVMYLTLECSSDNMAEKDDVVYQFPPTDSTLVSIRGLFITLSHMMHDVTNNSAKNSSLVIDGKLVHAAYCKDNRELLVICLPAHKMSLPLLNQLTDHVVRLLKLLFGSVNSAFSQPKNHSQLDHFFTILFQKLLLAEQFYENVGTSHIALEPFCDSLPTVRGLILPEETKLTVDNSLSELEAADFADMSENYYHLRRMYTIVGSCMFYKGYLLASHLHAEDLQDLALYLRYHCVLTLCQEAQLGQLLLWREVYPTRRCHRHVDPIIPGYTEPNARYFILIVGMKNLLLGVLLEAGGCAAAAEGAPGPDPFYVDQAKATLLQLESLDILSQCENRLHSAPVPSLSNVDDFLPAHKSKSQATDQNKGSPAHNSPHLQIKLPTKNTPSKEPESILKKKSTSTPQDDGRQKGRGAVYDADSDAESHSTGGTSEGSLPLLSRLWSSSQASEDSSGSGTNSLFKGGKRRRNLLSAYDMSGVRRALEDGGGDTGTLVKLTSGCDNTLFHYMSMDTLDGIMVCPCQQEVPTGALHKQVLHNFQQACVAIRKVFQQSRKHAAWSAHGGVGKFGVDDSLGHVTEHGVLFQCSPDSPSTDSKKPPPVLNYWVIGRVFTEPVEREFYVCFHDSAQQNSIEMAFKLGYGMTL